MTDIIKKMEMKSSPGVKTYLKKNPSVVQENISAFREELSELEAEEPILLAFGIDAYNLLYKNLRKYEYSKLVRLTHYSHQIGKEDYKKEVFNQINDALVMSLRPIYTFTKKPIWAD